LTQLSLYYARFSKTWLAADLGCFALKKETIWTRDKDGTLIVDTTEQAVSVRFEPLAQYFLIPTDYTERTPGEVLRELSRLYPNQFPPPGEQETHSNTYGCGWTAKHASRFAKELFKKYPDAKMYLEACRKVAARAYRKSRSDGVRITDPLDQETLQWNPILREIKRCRHGSNDEVRIQLPPAYRPGRDRYPVDKDELARRIAPCVIQLLDAFYSSLVMQRLWRSEVRNFVAIHDCWLVPERVKRGRKIRSGEEVLSRALQSAAAEWYRGLGAYIGRCAVTLMATRCTAHGSGEFTRSGRSA
jgi:hypothetical protein